MGRWQPARVSPARARAPARAGGVPGLSRPRRSLPRPPLLFQPLRHDQQRLRLQLGASAPPPGGRGESPPPQGYSPAPRGPPHSPPARGRAPRPPVPPGPPPPPPPGAPPPAAPPHRAVGDPAGVQAGSSVQAFGRSGV